MASDIALDGTWHVIATTFPMWLKGDRKSPRFVYSNMRTEGGRTRMNDTVVYTHDGREKTIRGIDTQDSKEPRRWRWRGRGWLVLFASDWEITHVAPDESWLVIAFTKSLVSPAGMDIVARAPQMKDDTFAEITAMLGDDGKTLRKL